MKRKVTFAILGYGSRGRDAYALYAKSHPERAAVVAVCDTDPKRLALAKKELGLADAVCFASPREFFSSPRLSDFLVIATQDKDHVRCALRALSKGYHLLLEKPISPDPRECLLLAEEAHKDRRVVIVCHVLRYSLFYIKLKELVSSGVVGRLENITAAEDIGYWHFAHSYVRGNWARQDVSSPMILAKSCHDMDIIRWLSGRPCVRVASFGSLDWFKEENAPKDAAKRCLSGCRVKEECPYDCEKIYFDNPYIGYDSIGNTAWPLNVVTARPEKESIYAALRKGPYGRCVYYCDNDVCDHQVVNMEFEGGLTASFTVSAFTQECKRNIKIAGTMGEIEGRLDEGLIYLKRFGKPQEVFETPADDTGFAGHGGGDDRIMEYMCRIMEEDDKSAMSAVDESVESHLIAMAAEYSRKRNGISVLLKDFENKAAEDRL